MSNYIFFIDSKSAENEALISYLNEWTQKLGVKANFNIVEDFTTIGSIINDTSNANTTYICVGKQEVFSALLAYAKLLEDNAVIGYIPLTKNPLAQKLGLKTHKDACKAIAQRKLFGITLHSINQYYMLFDYQLKIGDMPDDSNVQIFIDKKLQIQAPAESIKLINKQFDSDHPSKALVIEAYGGNTLDTDSTPILQNLSLKKSDTMASQLLLRLPFTGAQIEAPGNIIGPIGAPLRKPVLVGARTKQLRLIVKRGFEISQSEGDKLLSEDS